MSDTVIETESETADQIANPKRCRVPQKPSKQLEARLNDFDNFHKSVETKLKGGYHKPGSQNRNK